MILPVGLRESPLDARRRGGGTGGWRPRSGPSVEERAGDEARARRVLGWKLAFVPDPAFEDPAAGPAILGPEPDLPDDASPTRARPPEDLPPYLASLYDAPLLTPRQEDHLFRKMNYLMSRAARLRDGVDPGRAEAADLDGIERLRAEALEVKNRIIRANLRLVVSMVKRQPGPPGGFLERVSEGNLALIRAVERFDHLRGFKFSTYASWAILRDLARKASEWRKLNARFLTGQEEPFEGLTETRRDEREQVAARRHNEDAVRQLLGCLNDRERHILARRYGLDGSGKQTLEQTGRALGVTKERVRQIEVRAKKKMRRFALARRIEPQFL